MSALGQKQTYALQQAMSALHPIATEKADMRRVPFVRAGFLDIQFRLLRSGFCIRLSCNLGPFCLIFLPPCCVVSHAFEHLRWRTAYAWADQNIRGCKFVC